MANVTDMDTALELLTYLSPTPAPLSLLAHDLGLSGQREVRELIGELRARGFEIDITGGGGGGGPYAAYVAADWPTAQSAASAYWLSQHGGRP